MNGTPSEPALETKARRRILGGLAALLAAPLLFGKQAAARVLGTTEGPKAADPLPAPRITPPEHSVKRRS